MSIDLAGVPRFTEDELIEIAVQEEFELLRMRSPVLAYILGSAKAKPRVRAHENILDPIAVVKTIASPHTSPFKLSS